jgi:exopolysaccharide biosynthesis protein
MLRASLLSIFLFVSVSLYAQPEWKNVDQDFGPLPKTMHVFYSASRLDTGAFQAYYVIADLKDKDLVFTTDTTLNRRLTPAQFYTKNQRPLVVVNCTFFSFETNRNLNLVVKDGKLVSYNRELIPGRGKDTFTFRHVFTSALGITRKREADVAWTFTDSSKKFAYASEVPIGFYKDSSQHESLKRVVKRLGSLQNQDKTSFAGFHKWKVKTAIGGGPVLVQNRAILITNNEELKFPGKAINDKHPRTAIGYTKDHKLIILVVQGRSESASGASLLQEAQMLQSLGCIEGLNLDGGGSSCLLINGKETIKPSDKEGERPVPAVLIIKRK